MTRPLRVGFHLPEVEREVPWPEIATMVRTAEQIGFDSVWMGDHLLYRYEGEPVRGPWEAWTMLAAVAASTHRMAIGSLVACTGFRNPAVLAKEAATVDEISGGRLIVGLGAGWHEAEYRAFGLPCDRRVSRFEEAFTIIRKLLREGQVDFEGEFYEARDCELVPRPRPGGPPLLVGSTSERMLRITMPHVDAWNTWFHRHGNRPEGVPALRERVDAACREVGRDPAVVQRTTAVLVRPGGGPDDDRGSAVQGTPAQIAETLRGFAREGIDHVQLVIDPITEAAIEALAPVLDILDQGPS